MKISAPIYALKHRARQLARRGNIPLHEALDRTARQQGWHSWSQLARQINQDSACHWFERRLRAGDLTLLAARPGQGKTLLAMHVLINHIAANGHGRFFSLEYTSEQLLRQLSAINGKVPPSPDKLQLDTSDRICADWVIQSMSNCPPGSLAVVDYLQLLDQRRDNAPLTEQIQRLERFARTRQQIIICLAQIDRSFDPSVDAIPNATHLRMPNPFDPSAFTLMGFLHGSQHRAVRITSTLQTNHQ